MSDPSLNITFDLLEHARLNPRKPALALPEREITYRELDDLAWQSAQYLHDEGVRAGHVVALVFASEVLLSLAMLAIARLGATVLCLPRSATASQRKEWTQAARISMVVSDAGHPFDAGVPCIAFAGVRIVTKTRVDRAIADTHPQAPCFIAVGSGTTGKSKLIPILHSQMRGRFRLSRVTSTYEADSRVLHLSSLEFSSIQTYFFCTLHWGATFVMRDLTGRNVVDFCKDNSVSVIFLSVFHAESMLNKLPRAIRPWLDFLKVMRIGGSVVTDDLRSRIRTSLTENLLVGYGTNECLFISAAAPPEVYDVSGTIGRPLSGVSVEIVDALEKPVPHGAAGLIRVKSPALVDGYLYDDDATRRAFVDGWFYPGDLGRISGNGELIHCGRADQMMIMNGINIYPAEIENCLMNHPLVRDAAAMPVKHRVHQDVPVCAVSLVAGAAVSDTELLAFARERLGSHSPRLVIAMREIPRNEMGKIIRSELAQKLTQALNRKS